MKATAAVGLCVAGADEADMCGIDLLWGANGTCCRQCALSAYGMLGSSITLAVMRMSGLTGSVSAAASNSTAHWGRRVAFWGQCCTRCCRLAVLLLQLCLQVGEEEKGVSELLSAWGKDVAAAVASRASAAAAAAQHGQQHTQSASPQAGQQHGQTLQQAGLSAAAAAAAGSADAGVRASSSSSSSRDAGGADASSLAPGGSIELRNVYFEAVPLHLVSAVITDKGVLDKAQVAALMEARGKGYQRAFGLDLPDDMLAA